MKKWTYPLLGLLLIFSLSGCEKGAEKPVNLENLQEEESIVEKDEIEELVQEKVQDIEALEAIETSKEPEPGLDLDTDGPEPDTGAGEESENEDKPVIKPVVSLPDEVITPAMGQGGGGIVDGTVSNKYMSWYFKRNTEHQPPSAQQEFDIREYDGYYLGDVDNKVVYLTFDEGYENGYTEKILDVLLEKDVQAAFFVTKPYINSNPELIMRMVNEGHIVGNHSVTHSTMPNQTDEEIRYELEETARVFEELTGVEMPKFFRPPAGEYSARTLNTTKENGYKTVFWSFAYRDWLTDDQPGKAAAYNTIMNDLHNGMVLLLHAVSQSNTEALPDVIDSFREHGYEFLTLYDLD